MSFSLTTLIIVAVIFLIAGFIIGFLVYNNNKETSGKFADYAEKKADELKSKLN